MAKIFSTISRILNYECPYIYNSIGGNLKFCIVVNLFLFIFKPFHLNDGVENINYILAGMTIISFANLIIDYYVFGFFFPTFFDKENWTVKKQLLWVFIPLTTISTTEYFFQIKVMDLPWHGWEAYFNIYMQTFLYPQVPFWGMLIIQNNIDLNKKLALNHEICYSLQNKHIINENLLSIKSANKSGQVEFPVSSFLFVEAEKNYLNIYYIKDGQVVVEVMRNTIKDVEQQLKDFSNIIKCHRAYIVNIDQITSSRGNSMGYQLSINHIEKTIPVSRSFIEVFTERMKAINRI